MSRDAFAQIERDYAASQALREHAAMERAQVPPLAAEIDRLRRALARIAALDAEFPTDDSTAFLKALDIVAEALK